MANKYYIPKCFVEGLKEKTKRLKHSVSFGNVF